jgi:hypothetical protein
MIRVELPYHLRVLAKTGVEVQLDVHGAISQRTVLDALEAEFPMLRGMIRDPQTAIRRPYLRIFACAKDLSHQAPDEPLPEAVATGAEPLIVLGAVAGG